MKARGLVTDYAITGAMAANFWTEAVATFDLDVLVVLPAAAGMDILRPIYQWAEERGYTVEAEHIVIEGVPVQFMPAYNPLAEEAVRDARTLDYKGLPIRVVSPELLIGLFLDPPAKTARRRDRARMLAELPNIDRGLLEGILTRYHLTW